MCVSIVLEYDQSSVKVADFNDPLMCVYAAILNRLRSVPSSHTRFCQFENNREHCFRIRNGLVTVKNIGIKLNH